METTTIKKTISWWDWSGVFFSSLCLIHCIATPILLASASLWVASEWLHVTFLIILIPITVVSSRRALQSPRKREILFFLYSGLLVLVLAILLEPVMGEFFEIAATVGGSMLLITGHLKNRHCS